MIGHKAAIGLSLLCALLFSAIAAQSAAAAAGTTITAFTCVEEKEAKFDFEDAHCDKKSASKAGSFNHVAIPLGTKTEITVSNVTTGEATSPQVLAGKPFGVTANISCTTLTGSGTIENSEPKSLEHKLIGSGEVKYSGCTASLPVKCTVKSPIEAKVGSIETQEGMVGPKGEAGAMGIEFKPVAGKPFAEVTLEGAECALKGKPFPVEGSVIVTNGPGEAETQTNKWSGATGVVTTAESMSKLTAGGKAATYSGQATYRVKGGSPISITTATSQRPATNITAVTCTQTEGKSSDFTDAHCDKQSGTKTGQFSHVAIPLNSSTRVTVSNETTGGVTSNQVLAGKPFGVTTSISCAKLSSSGGRIENSEPKELEHKLTGSGTLLYAGCTASAPANCTVQEPIEVEIGSVEAQEGLTGPKGEVGAMGVEFKPAAGKPFTEVVLEGGECALAGKAFPVEGSVIVTNGPGTSAAQTNKWGGATGVVTAEESMSKLTAGGKSATYSGTATLRMEAEGCVAGNPIATTTVT